MQCLARRSQASKFQPGHQVKSLLRLSSRRLIQKRWQRPLLQWKKNTGKADHYATGARTQSARTYPGDPDNIVGSKSCGN
jgi:hypothetical protein